MKSLRSREVTLVFPKISSFLFRSQLSIVKPKQRSPLLTTSYSNLLVPPSSSKHTETLGAPSSFGLRGAGWAPRDKKFSPSPKLGGAPRGSEGPREGRRCSEGSEGARPGGGNGSPEMASINSLRFNEQKQ